MVKRRVNRRRRLKTLELSIRGQCSISVGVYANYAISRPSAPVLVHAETNEILLKKSGYICKESGKDLKPEKKCVEVVGEKVILTNDEAARLKAMADDGLQVTDVILT